MKIAALTLYLLLLFISGASAQNKQLQGWQLDDATTSGYYGISLNKAYDFLHDKKLKPVPVVVAILDDGIDTSHEDLRSVLWVNKKEIAGNKKDDDGNGYVDDIHGWNFLGNPDGRKVLANSSEWIRVYWRYKDAYEGKNIDASNLSPQEKYNYAIWTKARSGVVGKGMKPEQLKNLQTYLANAVFCDSVLRRSFTKEEFTEKQLRIYQPANSFEKKMKEFFLDLFTQISTPEAKNKFVIDELEKYVSGEIKRANGDKEPPEDIRREVTGDDDTNEQNIYYGNNDISNAPLMHGTHLAGIIGADRNNNMGMKGIADDIQIMMVRTSADGDEVDKDIATGIRYAVDNGAKVINMSFGKSLSPDKYMIDEAVKYALSKDVLIVQAAGNSKRDIDGFDNYPNPKYYLTEEMAPNWITVGASDTLGRAASFSNYGAEVVNVFAPGVAIYSAVPGGNTYMSWEGTSMAAPVVTGTAALLRSYFPNLEATAIKKILEQTVSMPSTETQKPGKEERVTLKQLCTSGGIVNAFNAVKMAYNLSK